MDYDLPENYNDSINKLIHEEATRCQVPDHIVREHMHIRKPKMPATDIVKLTQSNQRDDDFDQFQMSHALNSGFINEYQQKNKPPVKTKVITSKYSQQVLQFKPQLNTNLSNQQKAHCIKIGKLKPRPQTSMQRPIQKKIPDAFKYKQHLYHINGVEDAEFTKIRPKNSSKSTLKFKYQPLLIGAQKQERSKKIKSIEKTGGRVELLTIDQSNDTTILTKNHDIKFEGFRPTISFTKEQIQYTHNEGRKASLILQYNKTQGRSQEEYNQCILQKKRHNINKKISQRDPIPNTLQLNGEMCTMLYDDVHKVHRVSIVNDNNFKKVQKYINTQKKNNGIYENQIIEVDESSSSSSFENNPVARQKSIYQKIIKMQVNNLVNEQANTDDERTIENGSSEQSLGIQQPTRPKTQEGKRSTRQFKPPNYIDQKQENPWVFNQSLKSQRNLKNSSIKFDKPLSASKRLSQVSSQQNFTINLHQNIQTDKTNLRKSQMKFENKKNSAISREYTSGSKTARLSFYKNNSVSNYNIKTARGSTQVDEQSESLNDMKSKTIGISYSQQFYNQEKGLKQRYNHRQCVFGIRNKKLAGFQESVLHIIDKCKNREATQDLQQ